MKYRDDTVRVQTRKALLPCAVCDEPFAPHAHIGTQTDAKQPWRLMHMFACQAGHERVWGAS